MREIDIKAVKASSDKEKMEVFISNYEYYILQYTSSVVHRYIDKNDDEWSVALQAFATAVKKYSYEKGSFIPFAELLMKRRLIDYVRSQKKYEHEIFVDPELFEFNPKDDDQTDISIRLNMNENNSKSQSDDIKWEIDAIDQIIKQYGFTFFDLAECSPKTSRTKKACARAVIFILKTPALKASMQSTNMLPIKIIQKNTNLPRKLLERHRKYIIAASEIMTGNYPCLSEYMHFIKEELEK